MMGVWLAHTLSKRREREPSVVTALLLLGVVAAGLAVGALLAWRGRRDLLSVSSSYEKALVEQQRQSEQYRQHRQPSDGYMDRERVDHRLTHVCVGAPAHTYRLDNGRKIIMQQHQRCRFTGDIGAALSHRDAYVCCLQRGRIVHPVTGHGNDFPLCLERFHQCQFLLRLDTSKDIHATRMCGERCRIHAGNVIAREYFFMRQPRLPGDGSRRVRMISGNHSHAYAGTHALGHGIWYFGPQGIGQRGQP